MRQRNGRKLVAQAEVQREVWSQLPLVVGVSVNCLLVAVVSGVAHGTLGQVIRHRVIQVALQRGPLVIPARALGEALRADVLTIFSAELETVTPLHPAQVVDGLVGVLNRELRRARVRTNLYTVEFVDIDVGEDIQTWEGLAANC